MIAITGGGTGGHLAIAKAICEEYNKLGIKPIYIGSLNGQDRLWFENFDGFSKTYFLSTSGIVNKKGIKKIFSLANILKHTFACKNIFKDNNIKKVFCVGGYSAAAASFASIIFQKQLFIHEQNAVLGKLNKLLKPYAKQIFNSYKSYGYFTPYPIAQSFFSTQRVRKKLNTVLFLGGSQGAKAINELALNISLSLKEKNIKIIHQCGKNDFKRLDEFYKKNNIDVDLFEFSKHLHVKMQQADFAISRAGASSLWELTANGLPCFFIPYPYAASNHQYFNAKILSSQNLAFVSKESELDLHALLDLIFNADLEFISSNLIKQISPDGAKLIVQNMQSI